MRKSILGLLVLGVLASSSAFADRAIIGVMGTGDGGTVLDSAYNGGSFFYDDPYNMFYNPAYINDFKNWATIEKSNGAGTTTLPGGAEGGFVTSVMNMNLGLFVDRTGSMVGNYSSFGTNALVRPFDLIVGGDMGMKWGLGLTYASGTAMGHDSNLDIHVGAEVMGFDPFFSIMAIGSDATGASHSALRGGLKYHWGEWAPYAAILSQSLTPNGGTQTTQTNVGGGLGRSAKIAEGVRMNYALSFWSAKNGGAGTTENMVPIDISFEDDATSWLTLRAGLTYRFLDLTNGAAQPDSTSARVGAGIHMGKADFDFAVGKQDFVATTDGSSEASNNLNGQAFDLGTGLFSLAGFSYHW